MKTLRRLLDDNPHNAGGRPGRCLDSMWGWFRNCVPALCSEVQAQRRRQREPAL